MTLYVTILVSSTNLCLLLQLSKCWVGIYYVQNSFRCKMIILTLCPSLYNSTLLKYLNPLLKFKPWFPSSFPIPLLVSFYLLKKNFFVCKIVKCFWERNVLVNKESCEHHENASNLTNENVDNIQVKEVMNIVLHPNSWNFIKY